MFQKRELRLHQSPGLFLDEFATQHAKAANQASSQHEQRGGFRSSEDSERRVAGQQVLKSLVIVLLPIRAITQNALSARGYIVSV